MSYIIENMSYVLLYVLYIEKDMYVYIRHIIYTYICLFLLTFFYSKAFVKVGWQA